MFSYYYLTSFLSLLVPLLFQISNSNSLVYELAIHLILATQEKIDSNSLPKQLGINVKLPSHPCKAQIRAQRNCCHRDFHPIFHAAATLPARVCSSRTPAAQHRQHVPLLSSPACTRSPEFSIRWQCLVLLLTAHAHVLALFTPVAGFFSFVHMVL
jgi:hypothetical protein